jgi:DNA-binding CsgD family transcriptional regulator
MPQGLERVRPTLRPAPDSQARHQQEHLEHLLRQILTTGPVDTSQTSSAGVHEVLRVRIDGVDYALIRCEPTSAQRIALSPREQAIIRLIIKGYSNKALARVLDISPWTVATHLRRIFAKLDVGSRSEMVGRVLSERLLLTDASLNGDD